MGDLARRDLAGVEDLESRSDAALATAGLTDRLVAGEVDSSDSGGGMAAPTSHKINNQTWEDTDHT